MNYYIFLESEKTGDYDLTKNLRRIIKNGADEKEIIKLLKIKNIPGDEDFLEGLAEKILLKPPKQDYLTISNAFQWRLKYSNTIKLKDQINGAQYYEELY